MPLMAENVGVNGIVVLDFGLLERFNDKLGHDGFSGSWTSGQPKTSGGSAFVPALVIRILQNPLTGSWRVFRKFVRVAFV